MLERYPYYFFHCYDLKFKLVLNGWTDCLYKLGWIYTLHS